MANFSCDKGQTGNVADGVEERNIYLCSILCTPAKQSNNAVPPTTELIKLADMKGV